MTDIIRPPTAFSLSPGRRKRPRERSGSHLDFIRSMPCLVCGTEYDIHAAHIRAGNLSVGKRETGAGEKPSDRWSVPLCADHHVFGRDAQHTRGELLWWKEKGIDPFLVALALWGVSGDREAGESIIAFWRAYAHEERQ